MFSSLRRRTVGTLASIRRARLTLRGHTLLAVGAALVLLGTGFAAAPLVSAGWLLIFAVGAGVLWLSLTDPARAGGRIRVTRTAYPNPLTAGSRARVSLVVEAIDERERSIVEALQVSEQVAGELSAIRSLRADVTRRPGRLGLSYQIEPSRRGRWDLGPLLSRRIDAFGLARTQSPMGPVESVAVWPATANLVIPMSGLAAEANRAVLGTRSPSADDAALRDYRDGDDLRRVHWRSTARRGELMVRTDERAGRRLATVLSDLPVDEAETEWTISMTTSIALALLKAGHPVRMMTARSSTTGVTGSEGDHHVREDSSGAARSALLNLTVDLQPSETIEDAERDVVSAARALVADTYGGELIFAVIGPLSAEARTAVAQIERAGHCWALVRTPHGDVVEAVEARQTATALVRAGWHVCQVHPDEALERAWSRLIGLTEGEPGSEFAGLLEPDVAVAP